MIIGYVNLKIILLIAYIKNNQILFPISGVNFINGLIYTLLSDSGSEKTQYGGDDHCDNTRDPVSIALGYCN